MTVPELLATSRAAHEQYRQNAGRIRKDGAVSDFGNTAAALDAVQRAYAARMAAHLADVEHTDPAWAADKVPHDDLITFYQRYLA